MFREDKEMSFGCYGDLQQANCYARELVEFYGMTEGGGSCGLQCHEFPDKLHTVGRPLPGHDIRLDFTEPQELLPAGDRVVVISRQHAVPKAGQATMVVQVVEVWTIRDGLLAERRTFSTREEALEAVGPRE